LNITSPILVTVYYLSLKGAWSCHVTHFTFLVPLKYLEQLKLEISHFVHCVGHVKY